MNLRSCLSLIIIILPNKLKIPLYRRLFGYRIGKHVRIGLSLINVEDLEIGDFTVIGHLNRFKGIPQVKIGKHCSIGGLNTFTSNPEFTNAQGIESRGNQPMLVIGNHCGIGVRYYFDIQDTLSIGDYTTLAGVSSIFYTHYLDVINGNQSTKPVRIGKYCMIGANVRFVPGASVPDYCVVGMGSVVTKAFAEEYKLIGGNPAVAIRDLPQNAVYFNRAIGWIGSFGRNPTAE